MHVMKPARVFILVSLALLCALAIQAQPQTQATVGVPFTLDIGQGLIQTIDQEIAALGGLPAGFSFQLAFDTSSALPPGLTFSTFGILSGTPTTPGTYSVTVNFDYTITFPPEVGIAPITASIPFGTYPVVVSGGTGPPVTASPGGLSFSLTAGAAASQQIITVASHSSSPASFQASATGGSWLTVSGGGTAAAFGQSSVTVTVNPSSLQPGTYTGSVSISGSFPGSPLKVPVVVSVTGSKPLLTLSQSGMFFRASTGGPTPPALSFTVSNGGVGTLSWTAAASVFSGASWLSVSPSSGQSSSSSSPAVSVQVNPAGLAAGTYYGQVQVSSSGAPNSPQSVAVVLNVAASAVNVDPDVRPTGLIFVGNAGGTNPAAKKVNITNLGSTPVSYASTVGYASVNGWLSVSPGMGSIVAGTPSSPAVTVNIGKLTPGVYVGQVSFFFTEPNTSHNVAVILIVLPAGAGVGAPEAVSSDATLRREVSGCTPAKLIPVFTLLGQSFSTAVAWPVSLEITVVDDCGTPITAGSVVTSFSNGDEPLNLTSLNDGRWSGTWTPHSTASVSITATAQTVAPPLLGTASIGGSSTANPTVPLVNSGGIVNAAGDPRLLSRTPVAPGSYITIYGSALASGLTVASTDTFPTQLAGTQVLMAGQPIPLRFTSDGQINALVPYGMATDATLQLVVARSGAYSTPQPVTLADGGPAIFLNAQGGGIAQIAEPDGSYPLVDATHPASAGDALVIYCAGLGAVTGSVAAGTISPSSPLAATVNTVTVTIEGISANVFFAGLTPGFVGLYQVNAYVPAGVTTSATAPLVMTVAGQSSPPTPIVIK
jgi:uncharacterized protein (TIGR03437 family)